MKYIAEAFCIAAHEAIGQKRKYDGSPYYTHPVAVAAILSEYVSSDSMVAAAYLHDVVEDTAVTLEVITYVFGGVVAEYVAGLTNVSKKSDGNRAVRKALDRNHTWDQSDEVQIIKCADIIHNMSDLVATDFGKQYAKEKLLLLEGMRIQHHPIWTRAVNTCKSI
jgi:(p)ppGpp synthase/HD superfamily hydrolase